VFPIVSPVLRQFSKHKRAFALLLVLVSLMVVFLTAFFDASPVLFQSRESKTAEGSAVFNQISYKPGWDRDVWVMRQSHMGKNGDFTNWDRIAIVVEHESKKSAEFFQLMPGELEFSQDAQIEKRAVCFTCHSNGPRAIRPDFAAADVGGWDQLRLFLWNLRIKSYGPISSEKQKNDPAFRWQVDIANNVLDVKVCVRCHNDNHVFGRGQLTRQNFPVIDFMLREGLMPPKGFALNASDKNEVLRFIGR
jgi:hypothetical protein